MLTHVASEMQVEGHRVGVQFQDFSEQGARLQMTGKSPVKVGQQVVIAVGTVSPNIRARVRWITPSVTEPEQTMVGVEFESLLLEGSQSQEGEHLLEAWQEMTHSFSVFEAFLRILSTLDLEIGDGQKEDMRDAFHNLARWLSGHLGPVNLWAAFPEPDGTCSLQPLAVNYPPPGGDEHSQRERIARASETDMGQLEGAVAYLPGEGLVLECLSLPETESDLAQKLTRMLGQRMTLWTRLMMKNIALTLLSEQFQRLKED